MLSYVIYCFTQQIITEYYTTNHVMHPAYADCMFRTCKDVMEKGKGNAGLIGRAVGTIFSGLIGKIGAVFILLALLVLCIYIFYGMEMMRMLRKRNAYREEMQEVYMIRSAKRKSIMNRPIVFSKTKEKKIQGSI